PIVPLIAVGWADGSLSAREAQQILELAEERGAAKASPAHQSLSKMLQKAPEQAFVFACIYTLRRIYEALPDEVTKQAKRNLLGYSLVVARASGGILGLFGNKVSDDERSALETIAQTLGIDDDDEEAEPAPAMDAEESASTETEPAEQAENDPSQAPEADNDGEDEEDEEEDDSAEAVKKAD
ncbi:MAG: hypothetical protein RBU37_24245, partial [Myxococcota bacterium]|nr:hypothetical protein [Myxococcota bacterium]